MQIQHQNENNGDKIHELLTNSNKVCSQLPIASVLSAALFLKMKE